MKDARKIFVKFMAVLLTVIMIAGMPCYGMAGSETIEESDGTIRLSEEKCVIKP